MNMELRKLLSLILAIVLVVGLCPTAGFAEEAASPSSLIQEEEAASPLQPDTALPGEDSSGATDSSLAAEPSPASASSLSSLVASMSSLTGNDLYSLLKSADDGLRAEALKLLTPDQIASLKAVMPFKEFCAWFNITGFAAMTAKELADYLRALPSNQARIDLLIQLQTILSEEQLEALLLEFTEAEFTELFSLTGKIAGETDPAVDFSSAAPLVPLAASASKALASKSLSSAKTPGVPSTLSLETDENVSVSKTVTYDATNKNYKVKLETYTTGTVTPGTGSKPADIVLVLDVSGSMDDDFSTTYTFTLYGNQGNSYLYNSDRRSNLYTPLGDGTYAQVTLTRSGGSSSRVYTYSYKNASGVTVTPTSTGDSGTAPVPIYRRNTVTNSKLDALKAAVNSFIDSTLAQNAGITDPAKLSKIAVVTFASFAYTQINLTAVNTAGAATLKGIINNLTANGATRADLGMSTANSIFPAAPDASRSRAAILFTDGEPTSGNSFETSVANSTINNAKSLKDKGVTVYTVGIFSGANVNAGGPLPDNDSGPNNSGYNRMNRYMHLTSSNYPNATSLTNIGTGGSTGTASGSYYLAASDAAALTGVFQQISSQIGTPSVTLGSSAFVRDTVTPYFDIDGASSVTVQTSAYQGNNSWADPVTAAGVSYEVSGRTVTVTGFDFDKYYVTETARQVDGAASYGKKVIIEFTVTAAASFIGGNNVPTNVADQSGVYTIEDGQETAVSNFGDSPAANVSIRYATATLQNRDIYAGDDVTLTGLFKGSYNTVKTNPAATPYTLGTDVTNQYANVVYTVQQGTVTVGTYTVPAREALGSAACTWTGTSSLSDVLADQTYTVTATVTPSETADGSSTGPGNTSVSNLSIGTAYINVFKPIITPQDVSVYLTQNVNASGLNTRGQTAYGVVWKHGSSAANTSPIAEGGMGPAPALTYSYTGIPASYPTADTGITISDVTRTADSVALPVGTVSTVVKTSAAAAGTSFELFVLKPTVACSDTTVFLGDTTNLNDRIGTLAWPDVASSAPALYAPPTIITLSPVLVTGTAPGTDLTHYAPLVTSTFKVQLKLGGIEIPQALYTVMNNGADVSAAAQHFTVSVVTGQVTITKSGGSAGDSYIFTVTGGGRTFKEVIQGNGSKTITGLPKGTYAVAEDTKWSWRYILDAAFGNGGYQWANGDTDLGSTISDTSIAVAVKNKPDTPFWLSGETSAVNLFGLYGA